MQISFRGHCPTDRCIDVSEEDIKLLSRTLRTSFLNWVKYASFDPSAFPTESERTVSSLCRKYDVDPFHAQDRLSFLTALIEKMSDDASSPRGNQTN